VAILLGLLVQRYHINMLVGWAFAIAASAFFPLFVLSIWWRGLTVLGAAAGVLVGGGLAAASILVAMLSGAAMPRTLLGTLLAQPAIWTIPAAFLTMVGVSLLTRDWLAVDVGLKMLRLHVPESLGLRHEYIAD